MKVHPATVRTTAMLVSALGSSWPRFVPEVWGSFHLSPYWSGALLFLGIALFALSVAWHGLETGHISILGVNWQRGEVNFAATCCFYAFVAVLGLGGAAFFALEALRQ